MASNDVLAKLASLRHLFQQRLPEEYERLTELWEHWNNRGLDSDRQALMRQIHTLKGSSGTFGFTGMSERAAQLETSLDARQRNPLSAAVCYKNRLKEFQTAISGEGIVDTAASDAPPSIAAGIAQEPIPAPSTTTNSSSR